MTDRAEGGETGADPVALTQALVKCPSVTPDDAGALAVMEDFLGRAGFTCFRADRNGIVNLVARYGPKGHPRSFGFNGHTDVVPTGAAGDWADPPFDAVIRDGKLFGRGAADMKSGVAAFAAAAVDFVGAGAFDGAIVITITGDEEGDATDGTTAILDWMAREGETMSACLVGEPTCPNEMGEMIKIGRRGSMTAYFTVTGVQGHSAYPHRAKNPVHAIARLADRLASETLDEGSEHFDASTLAVTTIDTGNPANNVIPGEARATVNIRFNDLHSSASLTEWLGGVAADVSGATGCEITFTTKVSGESFITPPGPLSEMVLDAVEKVTGRRPELSTSGGTSDARFVQALCPVVEFGLVGTTMHKVDEHVEVTHIRQLKDVYSEILGAYFAG
ncbi:succinyl-diaminopimelate desuccinylase [Ovoidimarina sediminis]|uniref:succinyl-diaminopimelate desuccinylase n=1 Tax=Ovoidimarina sediminis TaxID=3079856 RepID=UPI00290C041A|nr:succinyl-diaminopimelate desuccinylase [Rhodophyticola sp. MJ-SS7]MDU8942553.1 succinyl-diaminopimelate desuccinylase [Rhodophyticola sp. MJ-SS7]